MSGLSWMSPGPFFGVRLLLVQNENNPKKKILNNQIVFTNKFKSSHWEEQYQWNVLSHDFEKDTY